MTPLQALRMESRYVYVSPQRDASYQMLWRYALALKLVNDEGAQIVSRCQEGEQLRLLVQTCAGERFEVLSPKLSYEAEQLLLEEVRKFFPA